MHILKATTAKETVAAALQVSVALGSAKRLVSEKKKATQKHTSQKKRKHTGQKKRQLQCWRETKHQNLRPLTPQYCPL